MQAVDLKHIINNKWPYGQQVDVKENKEDSILYYKFNPYMDLLL